MVWDLRRAKVDHDPLNEMTDSPAGLLDKPAQDAGASINQGHVVMAKAITGLIDLVELPFTVVNKFFANMEALFGGTNFNADRTDDINNTAGFHPLRALRVMNQPFIDSISQGFGGAPGHDFAGLQDWLSSRPVAQAVIDKIVNTLTGDSASGHTLADVGAALIAVPANFIAGVFSTLQIPFLDASQIITGAFDQDRVTNLRTDIGDRLLTRVFGTRIRSGSNLTIDPSFESTDTIWPPTSTTYYSGTFSTEQKHSGVRSRKIVRPVGAGSTFYLLVDPADNTVPARINVRSGEHYYAEVWTYPHASNLNTNGKVSIQGEFTDSTGANTTLLVPMLAEAHPINGAWSLLIGWCQVPAGYDRMSVYWAVDTSGSSGDAYYLDDVITREESAVQDVAVQLITSFFGGSAPTSTRSWDVRTAADNIYRQLVQNTRAIQSLQSTSAAHNPGNTSVNIDFSDYPDGPFPSIFEVVYSGIGTSRLGISGGSAAWATLVNDNDVTATVRYQVAATNTDFQIVRGTMASVPDPSQGGSGVPMLWGCARMSADRQNFVWCRIHSEGLGLYYADIGCRVAGVDYVWVSRIPMTWSLDMYWVAGVGADLRIFQLWSGNQLVRSFTENEHQFFKVNASSGTFTAAFNGSANTAALAYNVNASSLQTALEGLSTIGTGNIIVTGSYNNGFDIEFINARGEFDQPLLTINSGSLGAGGFLLQETVKGARSLNGASYRYWGAISEMKSAGLFTGARTPGTIAGTSVQDNALPAVRGSTAAMYRVDPTGQAIPGAGAFTALGAFFDHIDRQSSDVTPSTTNGTFTIKTEGSYTVNCRVHLLNNYSTTITLVVRVNGTVVRWGNGTDARNDANKGVGVHASLYLYANDVVDFATTQPGINITGGTTGAGMGGDSTASKAFCDITRVSEAA
jgi:hypothetical protein